MWINPKRTRTYVCNDDKKKAEEQQTKFKLRTLRAHEWEQRRDNSRVVVPGEPTRLLMGSWLQMTLRYGLTGVEGPTPVPFVVDVETGFVTDEFLDCLHPDVRQELGNAINALSTAGPDDLLE